MSHAERDRIVYRAAIQYLLGFGDYGVTREVLDSYANPKNPEKKHGRINAIYRRLVVSAQNANMKAAVVGQSVGGIDNLSPVLFAFNPRKVATKYGTDWKKLLEDIKSTVKPKGKIRTSTQSIWPQFCRSVLSSAGFLKQFKRASEFNKWVEFFDSDDRARPALPMLLAAQIEGYGFALACDFLKEIGYVNFCKPDVHVATILKELALIPLNAKPYGVFTGITRVAANNKVTPYNADKTLWLVGSGKLHRHPK